MKAGILPHAYGRLYVAALMLMPVIAMVAPRFTGLGPPLIAVLGLAAYYYVFRGLPSFSHRILLWALAFPALMALSALWGIGPETSFMRALKTLPIILSAPVLWSLAGTLDEKSVVLFRKFFPLAVIAAGVLCALELYANAPLYHLVHAAPDAEDRFGFSQLNRSVVVLTLCSIAALSFLEGKKRQALVLAAVMLAVLYGTYSQSAQLATLAAILFYFVFPYRKKWAWVAFGSILVALLFATPFLAQYIFHHLAAEAGGVSWLKHSYIPHRMEIWDFVSRRALEKPLLGHGAEAARQIRDYDTAKLYWPTTKVLHPHNFAVQLWIEFGALGALIAAAFFADVLRHIQKLEIARAKILLPLFIAGLCVATTGYGLWQSWWLGMFCLLFGYAALIVRKPEQ